MTDPNYNRFDSLPSFKDRYGSTQDKTSNLAKTKQDKLNRLGRRNDDANLSSGTYTVTDDGYMESNSNKLWNDYSAGEIQGEVAGAAKEALYTNPDGSLYQLDNSGNKLPYEGATRRAYMYGSKDDPSKVKFGLSRGDLPNSDYRYEPGAAEAEGFNVGRNGYGWESGSKGVDTSKPMLFDGTSGEAGMLLPNATATRLEGLVHGRKAALEGRSVRDVTSPRAILDYGSGISEYYNSPVGMFGDSRVDNADTSNLPINVAAESSANRLDNLTYVEKEAKKIREGIAEYKRKSANPVVNALKAVPAGAMKYGYDFADTLVEISGDALGKAVDTGGEFVGDAVALYNKPLGDSITSKAEKLGISIDKSFDLATDDEKAEGINSLIGYDNTYTKSQMEKVTNLYSDAVESAEFFSPSTWGTVDGGKLGQAVLEAFKDPETALYSIGYMGAALVGVVAKGFTKLVGGAVQEANDSISKIATDKDLTRKDRNTQIKEITANLSKRDRTKLFLVNNSDALVLGAVMNNNQLDEYIENNGGEDATLVRVLGGWLANAGAAKLDVSVMQGIIKGSDEAINKLQEVFKAEGKSVAAKTLATVTKFAATAGAAGIKEAPQEWLQTFVESFNKVYGATDSEGNYTDASEATTIAVPEANVGAIYGVSAGAQTSIAAQVIKPLNLNKLQSIKDEIAKRKKVKDVVPDDVNAEVNATSTDVENLAKAARRVGEGIIRGKLPIKEDNVHAYLSDIEDVKELLNILPKDDGKRDQIKHVYEQGVNALETFVKENPDIKLNKKSLKEFNKVLGSEAGGYTEASRALTAERVARTILGSERDYDDAFKAQLTKFMTNNNVPEDKAIKVVKSYASVELEATVEERGYGTMETRLKSLLSDENPDKGKIKKIHNSLNRFLNSTNKSILDIEAGETESKIVAATLNKAPSASYGKNPKTKQVPTKYRKANGEPYNINVTYNKKLDKWIPNVTDIKERLARKQITKKEITRILRDTSTSTSKLVEGVTIPDKMRVPEPDATTVKAIVSNRKADATYYSKAESLINGYTGKDYYINKVILDESTDEVNGKPNKGYKPKWSNSGDYKNLNTDKVNSLSNKEEGYSDTDVVLLHAIGQLPLKGGLLTSRLYKKKDNIARKELINAMAAGASIVLDRDYRDSTEGKKVVKAVSIILRKNGYTQLPSSNTFVKSEDNVTAKVKEANSKKSKKGAVTKRVNKTVSELADTLGMLEAKVDAKGNMLTKETLDSLEKTYEKALLDTAELSNKEPEDIDNAVISELKDRVKAVKKELKTEGVEDVDKLYERVFVEELAKTEYSDELSADAKVSKLLEGWKVLTEESRLEGKALDSAVKKLSDKLGMELTPKELSNELLGEVSIAKGKPPLWERVYKVDTYSNSKVVSTAIRYAPEWKTPTQRTMDAFRKGKAVFKDNKKTTPITYKKVDNDTTSYLKVDKTTVLNTVPMETLPKVFREVYHSFNKAFHKVIPMATASELGTGDTFKISRSGNLDLHNSPARGLVLDEVGTRTEVLLAMKVALMNSMANDKQKLKKGFKTNKDLALMFNVREHEVNKDIREFASDIGAFKKTIATKIGKDTLKLLGINKVDVESQGEGNFSRVVADLGNMALVVGKEEGLIEFVDKKANKLNKLLSDTEASQVSDKVNVTFVNLAANKKDSNGRYIIGSKVEDLIEEAKVIGDLVPETKTREIWPSLVKPTSEYIDKTIKSVRNDSIGMEVPEEARNALRTQMETAFVFDVKRVEDFLETVDNDSNNVKEILGYVDLESDKYNEMAFEDKDVQEAINDSVEKSIDDLRRFLVSNKHRAKDGKVELYFDFNYISNGRYHLDSNTINPQSDKLHRFLVMPKELEANLKVEGSSFSIDGADVNFNMRAAIGQAFGYGVDKARTVDIIEYGNVMLSLSTKQLEKVRRSILETGKAVVYSGANEFKLEAEHLTHTLQALDLLDAVAKGDSNVVSSLTLEFDSLTSGFANKIQQFPILGAVDDPNIHKHFARVGILTDEYQGNILEKPVVSTTKGTGMNDLLGSGDTIGFLDSYKNLAKLTLEGMKDTVAGMKGEDKTTADIFNGLSPVLPGGDAVMGRASMDITSEMRSMFKNPFMIFNYSASIGTITNTLSENIVSGVFKAVAKADLTNKEDKGTQVATYIVKRFGRLTGITTMEGLQKAVRTEGQGFVGKGRLYTELLKPIQATYGKQVKEVFESEFENFILLQDTINDSFKVMFRLFDAKRMELLKAAGLKGYVTKKDQKDILEVLWKDFPYIAGPLSKKGKLKEIIPVIDRVVGSPNVVEESAKAPQTRVNGKPNTNKVRPLITSIGEADSAGSVLPFHFIDGAEIAVMIKGFKEYLGEGKDVGLLAIHDAVIPSLLNADRVHWEYNKGMYNINKEYSIIEQLALRMEEISADTKYVKDLSTKGLKVATDDKGKHIDMAFVEALKTIKGQVKTQAKFIKTQREAWYTGPLKNALFANMVGSPAGAYKVGMTEPDMSYVDVYKDSYKPQKVSLKSTKVKAKKNKTKIQDKTSPTEVGKRFRRIKDECAV